MNFKMFDCEEAYSTFKLLETGRHEVLTDKCAILFFELKKINDKIEPNTRKKLWLQLINAETEEELDMLNETGVPEIQKGGINAPRDERGRRDTGNGEIEGKVDNGS